MLQDVAVHIVQRGNNRNACFFADQDRDFYLFHLGRLLPRAECALHAYCLMSNHVHLLVTPLRAESCAVLMKHIGQLYTQYVNKTYERTGTLWEGRFRSCIVQSETYALYCYRYIELNPVRAGMAKGPGDYEWSSYRVNAGGAASAMITPHPTFTSLGANDDDRRKAYQALFGSSSQSTIFAAIREATNGNLALGDRLFKDQMAAKLGRRVERGTAGRPGTDHVIPLCEKTWSVPD